MFICHHFQFSETLRKYPIVAVLNRTCVKDYKIPGTDQIVEKGIEVFLPVLSLQMDEKFWPEPEKFWPSRFIDESSAGKSLADRPYFPFGDGPRNCIGIFVGSLPLIF